MSEMKYMEISGQIEQKIRNSVYSGKLPSARTLSRELMISTRTLNKALKPLVAKGLIIPDGPRGILINDGTNLRKKTGIVAVFVSGKTPLSTGSPMLDSLKNLMEVDNFKMLMMSTFDDELYMNPDFWGSNWLDGYIFLYSSFKKEFVSNIKKKGIPFVAANWIPPEYGVNCVEFDNLGGLRKAVDYLYNAGRRKIALDFTHIPLPHLYDRIRNGFLEILSDYGIYNADYFHCADKCEKNFAQKGAEYFLALKNKPDAIIVYHQSAAIFENAFLKKGFRYPENILLVELGLDSYKPGKYPYLSASYRKLAEKAWFAFRRVLKNPSVETVSELLEIDFTSNTK